MSKQAEKFIITVLMTVLVMLGLTHCKISPETVAGEQPSNIISHSNSIGKVLGCMFNPEDCEEMKNAVEEEQMTTEFEELDKEDSQK